MVIMNYRLHKLDCRGGRKDRTVARVGLIKSFRKRGSQNRELEHVRGRGKWVKQNFEEERNLLHHKNNT